MSTPAPAPADPAPASATRSSAAVFRLRLVAACAALVGLAFVQDPGLLAADTKFDLVTAPADWLGRALHLWDAEGALGQLQNQAYGYLWPMGPFFLLGWLADLPGWVVQRLWQGLVMSVALVGAAKVARALGVRSDVAALTAGLAFALSPRLLTTLGPISVEAWPSALAPWVLLPLVLGATRGSPRRAAALAALAVAMVGGVNAAATFAVLPLGIVWLLTRTPGPRRRALMLWWPLFTALGTLWWLVPLFVMGAYSPPFLDFIETTSATTFPTTLFDALRGTSHWVPYVDPGSRAGNDLVTTPWLVLISGTLVLLGLAGLLDRRTPHRAFLAVSVVVGVLMVTAGHQGAVQGWFSGQLAGLLDGGLSPLRNVHKFDPVVRLPLVLGLAFVVDRAVTAVRADESRVDRVNRLVLVGAAVVAVLVAAMPAIQGRVQPAGATLGVPAYWEEAAAFVAAESEGGTALVAPGAPFAQYLWGDTADEPMQWLADSRWVTRNVIPLTPAGSIRMLDGIEQRFAEGRGSAGLTAALRRAGIEHLVVRNDLQRGTDVPDPVLVHQTIARSPGIEPVASFGPVVGGEAYLREGGNRVVVNGGRQEQYPAIEVFEVRGPSSPAVSADTPTVVAAGPEDLPDLLDLDLLGTAPVALAVDTPEEAERPGRVVLTDGLRARERFFPRVHDGASAVLTPGDVRRSGSPTRDYTLPGGDRWSTTARLDGAAALSASSSLSDADAATGSRRGHLPYAAVDGADDTEWRSGFSFDERPWWRLDLEEPSEADEVTVTAGVSEGRQRLRVVTEAGRSDEIAVSPGGTRRVVLPAGETSWVRVEPATVGRTLALAEVAVPGVEVERVLELPRLPEEWGAPDAVVLRADHDGRTGCVEIGFDDRCAAGRDRAPEEGPVLRRALELPAPGEYDVALSVRPRAGAGLDALLLRDQPAAVEASSLALPDPRASAPAAVDGNPATAWLADPDDQQVELRLSWLGRRVVSGIDLDLAPETAASLPTSVLLSWPAGRGRSERTVERTVRLGPGGQASFPAVRTDRLTIRVVGSEAVADLDSDGTSSPVPVGIGEVRVKGLPLLPIRPVAQERRLECGSGPDLEVGGRVLRTAVTASPSALLRGAEVPAEVCGTADRTLRLDGSVEVAAARNDAFDVATVVLTSVDDPGAPGPPVDAAEDLSGAVDRTLAPAAGDQVVSLRENANPGWVATQGGKDLRSVTLDGWQQGFVLDGDGPVAVRFAPDRTYRAGLVVGALAVVGLIAVLLLTRRRWAGPVPPPLEDRRLAVPLGAALGLGAAALVAGTVGLVVGVVAAGAVLVLRRRAPEPLPWVLAAPVLVVAAAYALTPWGDSAGWAGNDAWVGYLSVVPLVALPVAAAEAGPREGRRSLLSGLRRRMPGRSTSR